jgi:4'-phosphopantetheinyl transferase
MSLIKIFNNINSQIAFWKIENSSVFSNKINSNYHREIMSYKNFNRVNQILQTRALSYNLFPDEILSQYRSGKPYLKSNSVFISISNTKNFITIMSSIYPCGIDIQKGINSIEHLQHKFINNDDFADVNNQIDLMWTWCAKEAMYKVFGTKNINFKKHLIVLFNNGNFTGYCIHPEYKFSCNFNHKMLCNNYLIYTKDIIIN